MEKEKLTIDQVTIALVKTSYYGCPHCALADCQCKDHERFLPAINHLGRGTCWNYKLKIS